MYQYDLKDCHKELNILCCPVYIELEDLQVGFVLG